MNEFSKEELKKLGDNNRYSENYNEAIEAYNEAIEMDPNYKEAYNCRGIAYRKCKRYEDAIKDYSKVIEIDPNYKYGYFNRGLCYYDLKKYEKAIDDYTMAIDIDEYYKIAYRNRGKAYIEQKKYNKAIDDFAKAIKIDPNYEDAYNSWGLAYYYQGLYKEAIDEYNKVIEINPDYKYAYYNKALIFDKEGKYKEAVRESSKAIQIDPNYKQAYELWKKVNSKLTNEEEKNLYESKIIEVRAKDLKFYDYIEKVKMDADKKIKIYNLFLAVMDLKEKFICKDLNVIGHYTKIVNLKHLIKPEPKKSKKLDSEKEKTNSKNERPARLRLNNVAYMNDPTEGEVFIKLLNQKSGSDVEDLLNGIYNNKSNNSREVLNGKNNVFLVSFSTAIDTSLPMWIQYSENGEGCCLVFEAEKYFDKEDKNPLFYLPDENDDESTANETVPDSGVDINQDITSRENKKIYYCLYKVEYVENKMDGYKVNDTEIGELLKKVAENLILFKDDFKNNRNSAIKVIIQNILDQVRFLFKDKNYDHEEEVRLVKFEDNGNVKYTDNVEGFRVPHVYVELERELRFKEVILGPKVQNAIEIANYLYYTGKVDEVSKSRIKYK